MQHKKEPVIYTLNKLPQFIQMGVSDLWEQNKIPPEEMQKKNLVFTYFDGIYTGTVLHTDVFVHECAHYIRQGDGADELQAKDWWMKYMSDPEFRYQEEMIAYREQYQFILRLAKGNRQTAFNAAKGLAMELSGPLYGNLRSFNTALGDILRKV